MNYVVWLSVIKLQYMNIVTFKVLSSYTIKYDRVNYVVWLSVIKLPYMDNVSFKVLSSYTIKYDRVDNVSFKML